MRVRPIRYAEMSTSFPFDEALGATPLPSWSPSPSDAPFTLDDGAEGGGTPGGGLNIMAWVITLPMALIALMLSPP
jgi:hypothetical protein